MPTQKSEVKSKEPAGGQKCKELSASSQPDEQGGHNLMKRDRGSRQDCSPNRGHNGHLGPNSNPRGEGRRQFPRYCVPRRLFPVGLLSGATIRTKSLSSVCQPKAKVQATVPLYELKSGKACNPHTAEYPSGWQGKPSSTSAGVRLPHRYCMEHGGGESWISSKAVYSNDYIRADRAPPRNGDLAAGLAAVYFL